jgi:hypothetical protein
MHTDLQGRLMLPVTLASSQDYRVLHICIAAHGITAVGYPREGCHGLLTPVWLGLMKSILAQGLLSHFFLCCVILSVLCTDRTLSGSSLVQIKYPREMAQNNSVCLPDRQAGSNDPQHSTQHTSHAFPHGRVEHKARTILDQLCIPSGRTRRHSPPTTPVSSAPG